MIKKLFLPVVLLGSLALIGCGSAKNNFMLSTEGLSSGDYTVTVWSGGQAVKVYEVKNGFVNSEQKSDGWFFFTDGKLVRVSGTITIERK